MTRKNYKPLGLWLASAALLILPSTQAAPLQSASEQAPRVSLAQVTGIPGTSVMLPVSLTADPRNPLRSLDVEIEYVSNSLLFQKASPGLGAELVGAKLETKLTEGAANEQGVKRAKLRVTAALPDPNPKEGLPDGVLAYLLFEIAKEAKPFTIRLTPSILSAQDLSTPPKKVAQVGAEPGQVTVEDPSVVYDRLAPPVACFFFTH